MLTFVTRVKSLCPLSPISTLMYEVKSSHPTSQCCVTTEALADTCGLVDDWV